MCSVDLIYKYYVYIKSTKIDNLLHDHTQSVAAR